MGFDIVYDSVAEMFACCEDIVDVRFEEYKLQEFIKLVVKDRIEVITEFRTEGIKN